MSPSVFGAIFFLLRDFLEKHGILDGIPRNFFKSLKTDSKRFLMVQTFPSMSLRTFVNVIKLIWHNLKNTEFLTEFRIICSLIPLTLSTVWVPKCSSIIQCQLEEHRSDAFPLKTQCGKLGIFRGTFRGIFSKVLKLILNGSELSKYSPPWVGGSLQTYLSS